MIFCWNSVSGGPLFEDLPLFCGFLFKEKGQSFLGKKVEVFSEDVWERYLSKPLGGKLRELQNVIKGLFCDQRRFLLKKEGPAQGGL